MIAPLARLAARARRTHFVQAARFLELVARTRGRAGGRAGEAGIGGDAALREEPLHFAASDRMAIPTGDVAEIRVGEDGRATVVANVMGLVGATPVLPSYYSEVQLQRRRLRDRSMASFYNLFDHRALSFLYRITRKYNWLIGHERAGVEEADPVSDALLAYAGLPAAPVRDRLAFPDVTLAPLAGHLGGMRRSAAQVETVLRQATGLELRVREAVPAWLPVPAAEQTRLGGPALGRCARLGERASEDGESDAAMIGASVLDVQHHYEVEVGPLGRDDFLAFVTRDDMLARIRDACRLLTGIEHRPRLRLLVRREEAPPLRLGGAGACLSRATWLGMLDGREPVLADCIIPVARDEPPAAAPQPR